MTRHITPTTTALAFLAAALLFRAWTVGELATAWLMGIAYTGGLVSGVLVTLAIVREE